MVQIKLINMEIKEQLENKIIYRPKIIKEKLEYKIIFESKNSIQIQFIIFANFINNINFESDNNKQSKFEIIPNEGLLISFIIDVNNNFVININPIDFCTRIIIKNQCTNLINNLSSVIWDNIFIINLPRRSDRKEEMIKKLNQASISKYVFIEAFDGLDPIINEKFKQLKEKLFIPIVTVGHFACLLSHIKAIKLAKLHKYSSIMILEDDVFFCDDFFNKLNKLLVSQYHMLYLGGIISKKKIFFNDWAYAKSNKIMGAYGYILTDSIYDIVLAQLEKLTEYVDIMFIKEIQPNHPILILNDYIKTDLISSDTSHKSKKLIKRLEYIK